MPQAKFGAWVYDLVQGLQSVMKTLVAVAFGLVLVAFFWGLARYLWSGSDKMAEQGKSFMLWSIAAMFVVVAIWGIVALIGSLFGINANSATQGAGFIKEVNIDVSKVQ